MDDEYAKFIRRMNPPRFVIPNSNSPLFINFIISLCPFVMIFLMIIIYWLLELIIYCDLVWYCWWSFYLMKLLNNSKTPIWIYFFLVEILDFELLIWYFLETGSQLRTILVLMQLLSRYNLCVLLACELVFMFCCVAWFLSILLSGLSLVSRLTVLTSMESCLKWSKFLPTWTLLLRKHTSHLTVDGLWMVSSY